MQCLHSNMLSVVQFTHILVLTHSFPPILTKTDMSHPCGRRSWPQFRRTTLGRRHLDHIRWSWMTRSGSSSCGPMWRHRPSLPSCAAGCHSDNDSVGCSCTWTEAMRCRHCWPSPPWRGRCPVSGARSCEKMTCQNLIGWWVFVRDTLHLQGRKQNLDLFHFKLNDSAIEYIRCYIT